MPTLTASSDVKLNAAQKAAFERIKQAADKIEKDNSIRLKLYSCVGYDRDSHSPCVSVHISCYGYEDSLDILRDGVIVGGSFGRWGRINPAGTDFQARWAGRAKSYRAIQKAKVKDKEELKATGLVAHIQDVARKLSAYSPKVRVSTSGVSLSLIGNDCDGTVSIQGADEGDEEFLELKVRGDIDKVTSMTKDVAAALGQFLNPRKKKELIDLGNDLKFRLDELPDPST